jgi:uncharacterized protein YhfF
VVSPLGRGCPASLALASARGLPARGGALPLTDLPEFELGYPGTELRRRLVEAVLSGEKTATAGLHGDEPPAEVGDRFVVEDDTGTPRAIVEVTEVRAIPAGKVDLQFARDEGEGFESVRDWHEAHERFFERTIEPEALIEAIRFRVVERL